MALPTALLIQTARHLPQTRLAYWFALCGARPLDSISEPMAHRTYMSVQGGELKLSARDGMHSSRELRWFLCSLGNCYFETWAQRSFWSVSNAASKAPPRIATASH